MKGPNDFANWEGNEVVDNDEGHQRRQLFHPGWGEKPNTYVAPDENSEVGKAKRKHMDRIAKYGIKMDKEFGPLVYQPYAGGNKFPKIESANVKPGFKIWVDGGVLDYDTNPVYRMTCMSKQLDCSATCCM